MEKSNTILKFMFLLLYMLNITGCKGHNEKAENATQITKESVFFSEVEFTKISDYQNPEVKSLEINFTNFNFSLKFVDDRTYLRYSVAGKLMSDWKQISYNFNYDTSFIEAEEKIKILYNSKLNAGFLILPGYTEEYPIYNEYSFNITEIKYKENLTTTDFGCLKSMGNKFIGFQQGNSVEFKVNDCKLETEIVDDIVDSFTSSDLQKISNDYINKKNESSTINNENIKSSKNTNNFNPLGMFTINAAVESVTSGKNIKLQFNFYFRSEEEMNLKISSDKYEEAYCEGKYKLIKSRNFTAAKYDDEGICTENSEESNFYFKEMDSKMYIKSKRFTNQNWQELTKSL